MADPQIDNAVRAQCIWNAPSGLPTDRFVTSWAFVRITGSIATGGAQQADEVAERLREFWLEPAGGNIVASFLPTSIANRGLEIRCYDLGDPPGNKQAGIPGREPRIYNFPANFGNASPSLPREVAVTLSFYARRSTPRTRGRVYLGPLTQAATDGTPECKVSEAFRTCIAAAADRLANAEGAGDDMNWGVLSPTDEEIRGVTGGWVDDAFDTIRSRGQEAGTRTEWGGSS